MSKSPRVVRRITWQVDRAKGASALAATEGRRSKAARQRVDLDENAMPARCDAFKQPTLPCVGGSSV
jgi:hypothetical protein